MPRGRKAVVNYDEELMKIEMQITRWKNTIIELEERRQMLLEERERVELSNLYRAIQTSGRTIGEVLELLQAAPARSNESCMQA